MADTTNPPAQQQQPPAPEHKSGIGGGWIFFIILMIAVIGGFGGWVLWSRLRAKRLGLPTPSWNPFTSASDYGPSPARGGIVGWISAKVRSLRNRRHAPGAYESTAAEHGTAGPGGQHRGLDPDEAWDTRVGNEAEIYGPGPGGYYEEQELGLRQPTAYRGANYDAPASVGLAVEEERGRSRSREPERRYDSDATSHRSNPFGDQAERSDMSLRGVSPRPVIDTEQPKKAASKQKEDPNSAGSDNSPTERRSMFRENM